MFSNIMVAIDCQSASDTLCGTPYKLFKFSDPLSNCGEGEDTYDHGTRKLGIYVEKAGALWSSNECATK
jgi:hypothetical protein